MERDNLIVLRESCINIAYKGRGLYLMFHLEVFKHIRRIHPSVRLSLFVSHHWQGFLQLRLSKKTPYKALHMWVSKWCKLVFPYTKLAMLADLAFFFFQFKFYFLVLILTYHFFSYIIIN